MSDFELQPWEMPFDGCDGEVIEARANHLLDGRGAECQLHVIPSNPRNRTGNGREIPLFSVPQRWPNASFVQWDEDFDCPIYTRYSYALEPHSLIAEFASAWENDSIARLFWLNERGTLRQQGEVSCESLLVTASGIASWGYYGSTGGVTSAFPWAPPLTNCELAQLPASEIWGRIQQLLEDESSDARFARGFARLDFPSIRAIVFKWKHGTEDEFKAVLRDILLSHDVWGEERPNDELKLALRSEDEIEITFEDGYEVCQVDAPLALMRDVESACKCFQPFDPEVVNKRCVRRWMRHGMQYEQVEVTVKQPTAHEQLEARLRWREWQAEHL